MKSYILSLFCLLTWHISYCQTDTDEMLNSTKAHDFIQLWPDFNQKTFFYTVDADKNLKRHKTLNHKIVLGVPSRDNEIALAIKFFNPLRYTVKTTDSLLSDPSFQSVGKLVSSLTDLLKQLPNAPDATSTGTSGSSASQSNASKDTPGNKILSSSIETAGTFKTKSVVDANNTSVASTSVIALKITANEQTKLVDNKQQSDQLKIDAMWTELLNEIRSETLAEWKYLSTLGNVKCLDPDSYLLKQLKELDDRYFNTGFRRRIQNQLLVLSKQENIRDLKGENLRFIVLLDSLKKVNSSNKELVTSFDKLISGDIEKLIISKTINTTATAGGVCSDFATYSQIAFKRFVRTCQDNQVRRDRMIELADKLNSELNDLLNAADINMDSNNEGEIKTQNTIILNRYNISLEKMHDVTIVMQKREIDFDKDPPQILDTSEKIIGQVRIRSSQTLIAEFSSGLFFTNLSYPVYGVASLSATGTTIIDTPSNQRLPVVLAGMLNLTLNAFDGLAHPLIQLGVGTGKNLPTLLIGGGLRLRWTRPVIISAGAIFSWKRELDKLKVGDGITSTTQLENDLVYKFDTRPNFYLGIQIGL